MAAAPAPTRSTRQRAALAALLAELTEFRSAQEIHDLLQQRGEAVFRQCSTRHHHHLVCRSCGRTEEIAAPSVEAWARRVAEEHGYIEASHHVEVVGLCSDCAATATG